jgi:hypothetical protein
MTLPNFAILFCMSFGLRVPKDVINYLAFQSFNYECT